MRRPLRNVVLIIVVVFIMTWQTVMAEVMIFYLHMDVTSKEFSLPMPSFPQVIYLFFLKTYGNYFFPFLNRSRTQCLQ